jgi:Aldo/keto reductase family
MPRFQGDNLRRNLELVEELKEHAAAENCTPAQLALAWVLSRAPFIVPIPGTSHRYRFEENAAVSRCGAVGRVRAPTPARAKDRASSRRWRRGGAIEAFGFHRGGAETEMPDLPPPRHFPTLPNSAVRLCLDEGRHRVMG